ncbi:MAG: LamG domain-containing protein, partial [Bacteroidales bacterium]|nr:LamG domain-containing protein [Bacteroidales bacterium]
MKKLLTLLLTSAFFLITAGIFAQSTVCPSDLEISDDIPNTVQPVVQHTNVETVVPDGSKAMMAIPPASSSYSGNVRGYYFQAPTNFTVTGLRVPDDFSTADQTIEIVRFNSGPPPEYSSTTNDFVSLGYWAGVAGSGIIPCNIPVSTGDYIGIYGCRATTTSYGAAPYSTTIDGLPVTLHRSGMQFPLTTQQMHDIWGIAAGTFIGRIEMYYETAPVAEPVLHWRFANETVFQDGPDCVLQFDVEVSCDVAGTFHSDMQLYFDYNTLAFGNNIVANGKITYERLGLLLGDLSGTPLYAMYGNIDNNPSRYALLSEATFVVANPTFMNEVPMLPVWGGYARFQIIIADQGQLAGIDFVPQDGGVGIMDGGQYYVDATHPAATKYGIPPGYEGVYENDLLTQALTCAPCPPVAVWTGAISEDWNVAGNWDVVAIPCITTDVTIPSGVANYPTLTTAGECNNIYIESNAAGTATLLDNALLTVGGTATVERYYAAQTVSNLPELIYYKFDVPGAQVLNEASSPVGTSPAPILGQTVGSTGEFGTALIGNGLTSTSNYVNTGWATNLGTGPWTISLWVDDMENTTSTRYFFGDNTASSFRCFTGGVAGANNLLLRGTGVPDALATGVGPGPSVVHWAYDGTAIRVYVNGSLQNTVAATGINLVGTGPFKVGGYSSSTSIPLNTLLDEFRLYNRALDAAEIAATWNIPLGGGGGGAAWHLTSSPIADGLSGIYLGQYLQNYDETTMAWTDIIPVDVPLVPMQGYGFWATGDNTAYYTGSLNTGNIGFGYTANNPFGWNLLGNPYPSSIDWDLVTKPASMNGAVYYLDAASGNYVSYNGGMGGGSRYVPPVQGFFVSATGAGMLGFDNNVRTHMNGSGYYKSEAGNMVEIMAAGNGYFDRTYIRFDESATAGFDGQYDAYKLFGLEYNNLLPQIYTVSGDNLSIDVRPEAKAIPMSFRAGVDGGYVISAAEVKDIEYLYLRDLVTGQITDLNEASYSFTYKSGDNDARFML